MRRLRLSARARANRQNAQRSTGPKTREGKARVARNGVVHGLAAVGEHGSPISAVENLATRLIVDVADRFFGDGAALEATARRLAEAQMRVLEVRRVRRRFWERLLSGAPERDLEAEHLFQEASAFGYPPMRRYAARVAVRNAKRDEPLKNLDALEKYERRALARRKRAARDFMDVLASGLRVRRA